jgi:threonine/homoserine/homoserine lactone efflux protein
MPIETSNLPLFLSAVIALLLVPGPDFFLISTQATSRGIKHGIACALGIAFAGILQTALVAFGLGRLMEVWPFFATSLRLAGAMYLAFLGFCLLRNWWRNRGSRTIYLTPKRYCFFRFLFLNLSILRLGHRLPKLAFSD